MTTTDLLTAPMPTPMIETATGPRLRLWASTDGEYRAQPRWATPLRPWRPSNLQRLADIAARFGWSLLPWQLQALGLLGELFTREECEERGVPFGTPAYREVWWVVPRQAGKTTGLVVSSVDRCLFWRGIEHERRQRVAYTAQSGVAAREKLLEDFADELLDPAPAGLIRNELIRVNRAMSSTSIRFRHGVIAAGANSAASGHGKTLDMAQIDEAWHDVDDTRQGAMSPAMVTVDTAQIVGTSAAGTVASSYLNRKIRTGRRAAELDRGDGIAYLEYSADPEWLPTDFNPLDPEHAGVLELVLRSMHPAVGLTQSIGAIRTESESMDVEEFKRAYLTITTGAHGVQRIPGVAWEACCSPLHAAQGVEGQRVWGVALSADRSTGAVFTAVRDDDGGAVGELVDYGTGDGWVVERVNRLTAGNGGVVVYDKAGPVASIADKFTAPSNGIALVEACSRLHAGVIGGDYRVRSSETLDASLTGAATRRSGDLWAWVREGSPVDAAPIIAATCGLAGDTGGAQAQESWVLT